MLMDKIMMLGSARGFACASRARSSHEKTCSLHPFFLGIKKKAFVKKDNLEIGAVLQCQFGTFSYFGTYVILDQCQIFFIVK